MPFMRFANETNFFELQRFCALAASEGVFLHPHHNWFLCAAHTESDIAEMEADGTAAHAAHEVFEIYLVDVVEDPEGLRPVKYRELLRARGPTVHPQFGPQAEQGGQAS